MKFNSGLPAWAWVPVGAGIGMGAGSAFGGGIFLVVMGAILGTAAGVYLYSRAKKSEFEQQDQNNKDNSEK